MIISRLRTNYVMNSIHSWIERKRLKKSIRKWKILIRQKNSNVSRNFIRLPNIWVFRRVEILNEIVEEGFDAACQGRFNERMD